MKLRKIIRQTALGLAVMGTAIVLVPAGLASAAVRGTGAGVQMYDAKTALQYGTIVQLSDTKAGDTVEVATKAHLGQMYGVTVDPNQLSLTMSQDGLQNPTDVATSGTYNVLVSNEGGVIKDGDYVTLSSYDGIAMKAGTDESTVFGRAARGFQGKSDGISTLPLKDTSGKTLKTVSIGVIPVSIDIKRNPNEQSTKANVPKFLQRLGEQIAEKPVGPLRMYLSIAITGISLVSALVVLYAGVRNSIFSIGRNPLSKKSIIRALIEIILTSIIILIIGLFAVYLLLKL
jgi:hypothetical protein